MRLCIKYLLGFALIIMQVFIGARAFFPDEFAEKDDALEDILEAKSTILNKIPPEDLAYVANHSTVSIGVDPNFYPLETFDERGRYTGLAGDYAQILSKLTGLKFKPVALADWSATEGQAREGGVDVFMAAAKTGRRSEFMLFTPPYITLPGVIMTRRGSGIDKTDINGLAGKKVAVVRDYSWHDFLKEFHPEIKAVPAANTLDALRMVTDGEADAILDYEFNLMEKIQTAGILQMQTAGTVDSSYGHAIGVRKDKPELFDVLSMALAQITPAEQNAIAKKWLEKSRPAGIEKRLQWIFFFIVETFLVLLAINWFYGQERKREIDAIIRRLGRTRPKPAPAS